MNNNHKSMLNSILSETGCTQKSLARALDVNQVSLSRWLTGHYIPHKKYMSRIAEIALDPLEPMHGLQPRAKKVHKPLPVNPYPDALRTLLRLTGWTQAQLADRLNTYPSTLSRWLSDTHRPTRLVRRHIKALATEILEQRKNT